MNFFPRVINNTTYIIAQESYRNKKGQPRNKQTSLGKLDDKGQFISSKRKLPAELQEVTTVTKKFRVKDLPR